jgi:voltage-gated potassium channel
LSPLEVPDRMLQQLKLDRKWLGMSGVPADDRPLAYVLEQRLHAVMLGFALLAVFAFYLTEVEGSAPLRTTGHVLEWAVFLGFSAEILIMLTVTRQKLRYLLGNWLDALIVLAAGLAVAGHGAEWVAWTRLLRMATAGMVLARAASEIRLLFTRGGLPYILGFAVLAMLLAGAGFYWLDPSISSYPEGLWLAFVTAATVGYGDVVPSTPASRVLAVIIVIIGLALLSVVTASVAAFFIGEDEKNVRREMHADIRHMRDEVARLIGHEEVTLRREMHADIRELRDEVRALRKALERQGKV